MLLIILAIGAVWLAVAAVVVGVCMSSARGDRALFAQRLVQNGDVTMRARRPRHANDYWVPSLSRVTNRAQSAPLSVRW